MVSVFIFNDTPTTEIYTLSLHDALPICLRRRRLRRHDLGPALPQRHAGGRGFRGSAKTERQTVRPRVRRGRSEEHTSELQSRQYLVCRLLLEKKKKTKQRTYTSRNHINE